MTVEILKFINDLDNTFLLLVGNHSGEVFVLEASPEFRLLETNSIPEETMCASPAVAHNQVFLRTYKALWCFGAAD